MQSVNYILYIKRDKHLTSISINIFLSVKWIRTKREATQIAFHSRIINNILLKL